MIFPWSRKKHRTLPTAGDVTVENLYKVFLENQNSIAFLTDLLEAVAKDAREARAECQVLKLVVASLIAHVADEVSRQQTLDVVLGDAERMVIGLEAEFGPSEAYRQTIREIREDAEARLPKPS